MLRISMSMHTWRAPSGSTVNDIHDYPELELLEVKGGNWPNY